MLAVAGVLVGARIGAGEAANIMPGEAYPQLRAQLLAEGWKPNSSYGLKLANGRPMHRFPEVLCGMQKCRAKWFDGKGAEHAIMLDRGNGVEDYRVAPQ
jgi:hypothetical protein